MEPHRTSTPHTSLLLKVLTRGGGGSTGAVFHCKDNPLTFLCFKDLIRLGMASNVNIHNREHGISNSTGDAGSSFAPSGLLCSRITWSQG